ncbi:MAG: methyltransferase domain-containing protein [Ignavibacteriota bacterium]
MSNLLSALDASANALGVFQNALSVSSNNIANSSTPGYVKQIAQLEALPGFARRVALLDIGCGAGNYTLKLLQRLPLTRVTLVDLSRPMLDRAVERIYAAAPNVAVTAMQSDVREVALPESTFDVAVAGATLHHLRADAEWQRVFGVVYRALVPGGSLWISDLVTHQSAAIHNVMWERYGEYLAGLKGPGYRDQVFAYIEAEDTPRPLRWQIDLLARTGFRDIDVLHKNSCFAAFGAIKP